MGWEGHDLSEGWMLYTRGGISGVYIQKKGSYEEIPIPESLLRQLVADAIRTAKISQIESAEDDEILGF